MRLLRNFNLLGLLFRELSGLSYESYGGYGYDIYAAYDMWRQMNNMTNMQYEYYGSPLYGTASYDYRYFPTQNIGE